MNKRKTYGQPSTAPTEVQENYFQRMRLPNPDDLEQFAVVTQLMGSNQIRAVCEDGVEKQFRIPGKLLKKVWIREHDVIIVRLWDFQPTKGDVVWRYLGNQVEWLRRNGKLAHLNF